MAATLDEVLDEIAAIQARAREGDTERPRWPMIVLRTPKGWTGPEGGRRPAGRGHVPRAPGAAGEARRQPRAPRRARGVDALLPARGAVRRRRARCGAELAALAPEGERRMGANPHANGGAAAARPAAARLPRLRRRRSTRRARRVSEATRVLGALAARRHAREPDDANFRVFGPDETASNRLGAVFEVTDRAWMAERLPTATTTSRPTAASWRSSASTSARAGSRATC